MTKNEVIERNKTFSDIADEVRSKRSDLESRRDAMRPFLPNGVEDEVAVAIAKAYDMLGNAVAALYEAQDAVDDASGYCDDAVENEAWDDIETLKEQNAILREALERIKAERDNDIKTLTKAGYSAFDDWAADLAETALEAT